MTIDLSNRMVPSVRAHHDIAGQDCATPFQEADSETSRDLERWTRDIIEALNACDYTNDALKRLVPDFRSDRETVEGRYVQPTSKDEFLAKHRHWSTLVPQRTLKALDVVSNVENTKRKADVWAWMKVSGWGVGHMDTESVSCFKWQRSLGVWWCHQHTGMRGFTPMQCSY